MAWPNYKFWGALNEEWFEVSDCGELVLPTGRLLACDPNCYLGSSDPHLGGRVNVPPGRYPVKLTVERQGDSETWRVLYASLVLSTQPEVIRRHIRCAPDAQVQYLSDGVVPEGEAEEEFTGFPVETGMACLIDEGAVDQGSVEYAMPARPRSDLRCGEVYLQVSVEGTILVMFYAGMGDGRYPLVAGLDADGGLCGVHIDFCGPTELDELED